MGLGGFSAEGKIMIYSENYFALARCDKTTGEIKVQVAPMELSEPAFEEMLYSDTPIEKKITSSLIPVIIIWSLFVFIPVIAAINEWCSLETANAIMIFGPFFSLCQILMTESSHGYQKWHGAEHKAIAAYENHRRWDLKTIRAMPRETIFCGTRFMSGDLTFNFLLALCALIWDWFFVLNWVGLFLIRMISPFFDRFNLFFYPPVSWINILIQYFFTTSEPGDKELATAQTALFALIMVDQDLEADLILKN